MLREVLLVRLLCCVVGIHYCSTSFKSLYCVIWWSHQSANTRNYQRLKTQSFADRKRLRREGVSILSVWQPVTRHFFSLAEIFASNKSNLCLICQPCIQFFFFKFPLQVTSGISTSTLKIRQERTSRFYLHVEIEDPCLIQTDSKVFSK